MRKIKIVFALAGAALASGFASAQTLTSDGEITNATSITPSLGYELYCYDGNFGSIRDLPSFVIGESPGGSSSNEYRQGATQLTVDGTTYSTGEITTNGGVADTLTLGNTIPSSFVLGTMINTQGAANQGTSTQLTIDLYSSNGTLLDSVVDGASAGVSTTANDIYYTTIAGALSGDYITFSLIAPGNSNGPSLSAITFDSTSTFIETPEPRTWALLLGGVAFLGFTVLRRRQQA